MRILMVTPYPPYRDGIGSYAVQQVGQLLRAGHDVEVLSPTPSAAHHHLDFSGWRGPLALAKRTPGYDLTIVQYHPDVFYPATAGTRLRLAITLGLALAWRRSRQVEIRVHEVDSTLERGLQRSAARLMWRQVDSVMFHSPVEKLDFERCFDLSGDRLTVEDHGAHFVARTALDRDEARQRLGLTTTEHVFVCVGFVQPHKGFDRAVCAFAGLAGTGARLEIVGSVRVEESHFVEYAEDLHRLADATPGVTFHERYVSDEEFDLWIVAADTVVLPYRFIWSSSVLERCQLYGRHAVASRVGGLADQGVADVDWIDTDEELRSAMRRRVGGGQLPARPGVSPWRIELDADGAPDQREIQDQIRRRAADEWSHLPQLSALPPRLDGVESDRSSRPLRRISPLAMPVPTSRWRAFAAVKRVVRRLTAWQVDPLVHQLNALRDATIESIAAVGDQARSDAPTGPAATIEEDISSTRESSGDCS